MDLHAIGRTMRAYWRSMVLLLVVSAAIAAPVLMSEPRQYTASAQVNFLPKKGATNYDLSSTMDFAATQAQLYAQLARTPVVLDPVREQLGVATPAGQLANVVWASAEKTQPLVTVTVTTRDPEFSARLCNAVADNIVKAIPDYSPPETANALTVEVTSPAQVPQTPSSPDLRRSIMMAALIGLGVSVGQALLRANVNTTIRSSDDVARVTSAPVLAQVPWDASTPSGPRPYSPRSEAFADLRTNLDFRALEGGANCILVTSSIPGEGKTTTATELARVLAKRGQRVILMDCDWRRPRIHEELGIAGTPGLTNALLGSLPVLDVIQRIDGVDVLVAGRVPPNPAELLVSAPMGQLLDALKDAYEVVVIDAPPLLPVTDAVALSRTGAGVLVVAEAGRLRRRQLHDGLTKLNAVHASVLGIVLNMVKSGTHGYYGHGYAYNGEQQDKATPTKGRRARPGKPR